MTMASILRKVVTIGLLLLSVWNTGKAANLTFANYEIRLVDFGHQDNYRRLEIRQSDAEWGTICCSAHCNKPDETQGYLTDFKDICRMLGYTSVIGIRNDLEDLPNASSVHLSLDYYKERELDVNLSSVYELGISEWYTPNCNSTDNIYLSCLSEHDSFDWRLLGSDKNYDWHPYPKNEPRRFIRSGDLQVRRNNGSWGYICLQRIPDKKALLHICKKSLGYNMSGIAPDVLQMSTVVIMGQSTQLFGDIIWDDFNIPTLASTWGNVKCQDPLEQVPHIYCYYANYALRLVDLGHPDDYHRVEVRHEDGDWGSMCCGAYCDAHRSGKSFFEGQFDSICKLLGYKLAIGVRNDLETNDSLPVYLSMDYENSFSISASIYDMGISEWYKPSCTSRNNLFISCLSDQESIEWRLVNDFNSNITQRGRLEVRRNQGPWGSVCFKKDIGHIMVANMCEKNLGFSYSSYRTGFPDDYVSWMMPIFAWEGLYFGPIIFDDLNIVGSDSWNDTYCPNRRVIHISCDEEISADVGQYRLVNGSGAFEGRLEFKFIEDVHWRAVVTSASFRLYDFRPYLEKICEHLGFGTYLTYYTWSKFGGGDGLSYQMGSTFDVDIAEDHSQDAGLICVPNKTISSRLNGDPTDDGAVVEVFNGLSWGRVCVDHWDINYADVVCHEFGFQSAIRALSIPVNKSTESAVRTLLNPDSFRYRECDGELYSIPCRGFMSENCECQHSHAGVRCSGSEANRITLSDKMSDTRLVPFRNGSSNLYKVQVRFHHMWYQVCGSLYFMYGKLGHFERRCSMSLDRDDVSVRQINSTHAVLLQGLTHGAEFLFVVEGNCSALGFSETLYFCQKVEWDMLVRSFIVYDYPNSCEGRCNHDDVGSCRCDQDCIAFKDCCFDYDVMCDAISIQSDASIDPKLSSCYDFVFHRIVLVDKCPSTWNEPDIESLCNNRVNDMLVYDQHGNNFRNIFCAICNHRKINHVHPWHTISFDSKDCHETALHTGSIFLDFPNEHNLEFIVGVGLRVCYPVSQCPPSTDSLLVERCESHIVYLHPQCGNAGMRGYKNAYCYICHHAFIPRCRGVGYKSMWQFRAETHKAATLQQVESCLSNEIRDPITQSCRQVSCRPGYRFSLTSASCVLSQNSNWLIIDKRPCPNLHAKVFFKQRAKRRDVMNCMKNIFDWSLVDRDYKLASHDDTEWLAFEMKNRENIIDLLRILENTLHDSDEANSIEMEDLFCGITNMEILLTCDDDPAGDLLNCTGNWYTGSPTDFLTLNNAFDLSSILYLPNDTLIAPNIVIYYALYYLEVWRIQKRDQMFICGDVINSTPRLECSFVVLNSSEYFLKNNDTLLEYGGNDFQSDDFSVLSNGQAQVCLAPFLKTRYDVAVIEQQSVFTPLEVVSLVATSMSMFGSFGTLIAYVKFKSLHNVYGSVIMSLSVWLFLAQGFNILLAFAVLSEEVCTAVAVIRHYFWLATFTWTSIGACVLFYQFAIDRLRLNSVSTNTKSITILQIVGWGLPLLFVGALVALHLYPSSSLRGMFYEGEDCWIFSGLANLFAFGIPVAVSLFINSTLVAITLLKLHKARKRSRELQHKLTKEKNWTEVLIFGKVSSVLGLGWILMFLASAVDMKPLWWFSVIMSSLQGVHIFIAFGINVNVR